MNESLSINAILSKRTTFPPGDQVAVTPRIENASHQFSSLAPQQLFSSVHDWIFTQLKILPYGVSNPGSVEEEAKRRWKLTADELLQVGTIYDGKYCNDVVSLFNSIMLALGHDSKVAKVFKKNPSGNILVHSLSLVTPSSERENVFAINAGGTKENFWVLPVSLNDKVISDWVVWKIARDQWEMGLTDSSQEKPTIITDAKKYYQKKM